MSVVGAAATAEHRKPRMPAHQGAILRGKFVGIAVVEIGSAVQFLMTSTGGVGAHPPDPPHPRRAGREHGGEVVGKDAVTIVFNRAVLSLGSNFGPASTAPPIDGAGNPVLLWTCNNGVGEGATPPIQSR